VLMIIQPLSAVIQCADDICSLAEEAKLRDSDFQSLMISLDGILESAQTILLCSAHSKTLVDDVLTFSKLGSSLLQMTPVLINPVEIGRQVTQMFRAEAAASDIDLTYGTMKSFDDLGLNYFHGDPTRMTQCLVNLATNSIKVSKLP
jgi:signal transduction histidine kinase